MNGPDFLDTNILVYAYDASSPRKQHLARELLQRGIVGEVVTSTQVLAEFAATLLHKGNSPANPKEVLRILDALSPIKTIATDAQMVARAVEAKDAYAIHFYDAMIIAAAERCGASRIWSEDFNAGQQYFGATVQNPFR
ncbi:MAG: PIN domain-containing protein [Acidobacteria bacterium]|nr:PIN domain-containing protein [Acidobacteriota bacterium]MBV9145648.1 PIN domain-containing protein [Acidobacteriota bacterium]